MKMLLDTNVISELRKGKKCNKNVWARFGNPETRVEGEKYISVITIGEIRRGIEKISRRNDHAQATLLTEWLGKTTKQYENNILDIDKDVANVWGVLTGQGQQNSIDKLIAATAIVYGMTVVTRNFNDFLGLSAGNLSYINPFEDEFVINVCDSFESNSLDFELELELSE